MSEILVDSYSEGNTNTYIKLHDGFSTRNGQSFTAVAGKLSSCKFYLYKYGSPTGNIVAKLYSHSGVYGESSIGDTLLATSDIVDVSTIGSSYHLQTFNFSGLNQYTLIDETNYVILLEYTGGNDNNHIRMGRDSTSPTHDGNLVFYDEGWGYVNSHDLCFYVYSLGAEEDFGEEMIQQVDT